MRFDYKHSLLGFTLILSGVNGALAQSKSTEQKLLRHVVVASFKPGTSAIQMQAVDNSFQHLAKMKMVKGYEWDIGSDDRDTLHVKHVYVTTFAGKKEAATYGRSPEHQAHIKLGAGYIESVSATDYVISK